MTSISDFFSALGGTPNQTPFDQADNGTVSITPDGTSTSYTPPDWLTSLQSLASGAANVYKGVSGVVDQVSGSNPNSGIVGPAKNPPQGAAPAKAQSKTPWTWIIVGAAAVLGLIIFLIRRK